MHSVGAFEAKTHFSALLEQVEKGEQIIITKHGHPVAKLVPTKTSVNREHVLNVIQRLKKLSEKYTLGNLDWKMLRDQGRR